MNTLFDRYLLGLDVLGAQGAQKVRAQDEVIGYAVEPPVVESKTLPSPISHVPREAWTTFCRAMQTQRLGQVSESNSLGLFELKPRRLGDLGLVDRLSLTRASNGRMVWVGSFKPPLSAKAFLTNPLLQYNSFVQSMVSYMREIRNGSIVLPDGMSLSGALAILHRCGPKGIVNWHQEKGRFPDTKAAYERAKDIF